MSTYTKTTNFTAKDNLTSGDPAKVIKGSEFDTEFNSIETAVNSKADANNGTHTGTTTISTADIDTLQIDSVEVTATAAELNTLDGITSTTAELNKLDGFTGTVDDLNYAKDLRATGVTSAELDKIDGLTADSTELNILDGATVTTAELNTLDGITSTTAELNVLDGITATTAELNVLDGVTSTTAEINKLDGFTGTVADLNYAKDLRATGVTTAELDVLDGITATTAELNITDGLTATTAELNTLDGITATTTELNYTDGVTSNIQTQLNAMVEKAGDTMTGDLDFGDNVKAKFGTGDDLQIFHNGSTSVIEDSGTGNLQIRAQDFYITNSAGTELLMGAVVDGAVDLYHNNSKKLATKSTGVDVTGTVTADGLTVAPDANRDLQANSYGSFSMRIENTTSDVGGIIDIKSNGGITTTSGSKTQFKVDGATGDVHLYEDTGTTAKFVWDSSAESLKIGTGSGRGGSNSRLLSIKDTGTNYLELQTDASSTCGLLFSDGNTGDYGAVQYNHGGDYLELFTASLERMRIDSSGNVGIGTNSPIAKLTVDGQVRASGTAGYGFNSPGDTDGGMFSPSDGVVSFKTNGSERARIDSSGNVGIGTASPQNALHVASADAVLRLETTSTTGQAGVQFWDAQGGTNKQAEIRYNDSSNVFTIQGNANGTVFLTPSNTFPNASESMRLDSSGNLLVAKSAISTATVGHMQLASGLTTSTRSGGEVQVLNRLSSDGDIVHFRKDGSTVGSISTAAGFPIIGKSNTGIIFDTVANGIYPQSTGGANQNGTTDLGNALSRFKDLYLSGGVKYSESTITVQSGTPTTVASFGAGIGSKFCGIIHVRDTGGTHIGASAIVTSFANGGTALVSIMQTASGASNSTLSVSGANILFSHVYGSGRNFKVTLTPFSTGG